MNYEKEIIVVLFVIILVWLLITWNKEGFSNISSVSLPLGYPRYGLRGNLWVTEPISTLYLNRFPDVRLHPSNNDMYESNRPPGDEMVPRCSKHKCPSTPDNYFKGDPCWMCAFQEEHPKEFNPWDTYYQGK